MMTRELATLLDAGLTLDQALKLLVELADGEPLGACSRPVERIQGGSALADALGQHERVLARLRQHGARRRGGRRAARVLGRLARYLEEAEALREQVGRRWSTRAPADHGRRSRS